jgi:hypothetical protein
MPLHFLTNIDTDDFAEKFEHCQIGSAELTGPYLNKPDALQPNELALSKLQFVVTAWMHQTLTLRKDLASITPLGPGLAA